jgi:hypothetical protein
VGECDADAFRFTLSREGHKPLCAW